MTDEYAALRAALATGDAQHVHTDTWRTASTPETIARLLAELDTVKLLAQQARTQALKDAAKVAAETVCDVHLPTGVRIYGTKAGKAILAMIPPEATGK